MRTIRYRYSFQDPQFESDFHADADKLELAPRVEGIISPGHIMVIPLNFTVTGIRPVMIVSLDQDTALHGGIIVSGPLLRFSEAGEANVSVKAVDPLWDVDLKRLRVEAIPVSATGTGKFEPK